MDPRTGILLRIDHGEPEEARYEELATRVAEALCREYPNYFWRVLFQGGALMIRNQLINDAIIARTGLVAFGDAFSSLLPKRCMGTVREVEESALEHAGKMLEEFKLPRGPWKGEMAEVPERIYRKIMERRGLSGWNV